MPGLYAALEREYNEYGTVSVQRDCDVHGEPTMTGYLSKVSLIMSHTGLQVPAPWLEIAVQ